MIRLGPIARKSNFHSREKCLIGLVLVTLCLLCFAGIFLLPDNFGSEGVLRVYKQLQKAGPEIFIPPPPLATRPAGLQVIRWHSDREKLEAKIREEMGDSLDKPQLQREAFFDENLSTSVHQMVDVVNGGNLPIPQTALPPPPHHKGFHHPNVSSTLSNDELAGLDTNNLPVGAFNLQMGLGGHSDNDPKVDIKRQKVLQVSTIFVLNLFK